VLLLPVANARAICALNSTDIPIAFEGHQEKLHYNYRATFANGDLFKMSLKFLSWTYFLTYDVGMKNTALIAIHYWPSLRIKLETYNNQIDQRHGVQLNVPQVHNANHVNNHDRNKTCYYERCEQIKRQKYKCTDEYCRQCQYQLYCGIFPYCQILFVEHIEHASKLKKIRVVIFCGFKESCLASSFV
jgi:hypothetical protein